MVLKFFLNLAFFSFFANFWVTKLKVFSGKVRKSVQNYLNQTLVIRSISENGFEATWRSEKMFWTFGNWIFTFFCEFLSEELKSFIGKVRQSVKNCLNQNFFIWAFSENGFEATLKSKANCYQSLKIAFFRPLQIFDWQCWHPYKGKWGKALKTI